MCPNVLLLPYLQAQTVGLPVTVHSPNVRLMRSALLPPASNVDAFAFPASGCQAEAAFMEEECVDTPKVQMCLSDAELAGWLEARTWSRDAVLRLSGAWSFPQVTQECCFCAEGLRTVPGLNSAHLQLVRPQVYFPEFLLFSLSFNLSSCSRVLDPS